MAWTEERVELLAKLWGEGLSASQIALRLGDVTRNAVIGKVHRLGLSGRAAPARQKGARTGARHRPALKPAAVKPEVIEEARLPDGSFATVLTIRDHMCKWPHGHPSDEDFHFCGRAAPSPLPYCDAHARMAYQASTPRRERRRAPRPPLPPVRTAVG